MSANVPLGGSVCPLMKGPSFTCYWLPPSSADSKIALQPLPSRFRNARNQASKASLPKRSVATRANSPTGAVRHASLRSSFLRSPRLSRRARSSSTLSSPENRAMSDGFRRSPARPMTSASLSVKWSEAALTTGISCRRKRLGLCSSLCKGQDAFGCQLHAFVRWQRD